MINNNIHKINYLIKNNKYIILDFPNNIEFTNINNKCEYENALYYINKTNNS